MMIMRTAKDDLAAFHYAEAMAFRGFRICGFCPRPTAFAIAWTTAIRTSKPGATSTLAFRRTAKRETEGIQHEQVR